MSCYVKKYHQNLVVDQQFIRHLTMLLAKVFLTKNSQKVIEESEITAYQKVIL